jgi:hypothetical protein
LAACCNEIKQDKGKAARFMGCFFSCRKSGILCRKKEMKAFILRYAMYQKRVGQKMSRFFQKIQNTLLCNGEIWGILSIGKNFPRGTEELQKW